MKKSDMAKSVNKFTEFEKSSEFPINTLDEVRFSPHWLLIYLVKQ